MNCLFFTPPALQVIEVRQKESPYLLPEDVFIDNPKYDPATNTNRTDFQFDLIVCSFAVNFPVYVFTQFTSLVLGCPLHWRR